jgi:hypothetical protein
MLMHDSGEWICSIAGSPISKNNPQGVGDAVTYLRRYSLAAISGLGQEDDDGNSNNGNSTEKGNDDKNWYSDELLAEHRPYIIGQKNAGVTAEAIVKKMRDKYKVANKYKQLIEDMT